MNVTETETVWAAVAASLFPRWDEAIGALGVVHVSVGVDGDRCRSSLGRDEPGQYLLRQRSVVGALVFPVRAPAPSGDGGGHLVGLLKVGEVRVVRDRAAGTALGVDYEGNTGRLVPVVYLHGSADHRLRTGEYREPACAIEVAHEVIVHYPSRRHRRRRGLM